MNDEDKDALKEFMRGAAFAVVAVGIAIMGIIIMSRGDVPGHKQSTEVVGTYKDCDIIQWHYSALAEYKYFLHCPK